MCQGPYWQGGGRGLEGDEGLLRGGRSVNGRVGTNGNGELGLSTVFHSDEVWGGNGMLHDSGDPGSLVSCL